MKVSVAVLTYQHAPFLERAVRSALAQDTAFPFEVVIGDDDSRDGTRQVAERLAQDDPRVRVLLPEPNLGAPRNLERLLRAAEGEYIAVLEGDDRWSSTEKLARMVELLDATPQLSAAYHAVRWVDDRGTTLRIGPDRPGPMTREALLRDGSSVPLSALVMRNALPVPLPRAMFATRIMADWQLSLALAQQGSIGYLDAVMGEYLVRSGPDAFSAMSAAGGLVETLRVIDALAAEATAGERSWLESHRSVHLFELARALSADHRHDDAVRAGIAAARLRTLPARLTPRDKRLGLARVAIAALGYPAWATRRRALRLLVEPARVLR